MALTVIGGDLDGHAIRRARKRTYCCEDHADIMPGQYYTELECDPYTAGGFGMKKLCMACAPIEARAALEAASREGE